MTDQTRRSLDEVNGDTLPALMTLGDAARLDPPAARALLGTKAANLARLRGAGFPVPAGVVVTPAAAADWDQVDALLRTVVVELGGGQDQRFAVRSSARAEDLAGASFAGMYETVLDVGVDELSDAVRQVWDSATSARLAAYRQAHPQAATADVSESGAGMAVLVQIMVPAAAGVAFSANPVSGARDEVVISAVRGLGERLVAGQTSGDQWVVGDSQARCTRATEHAITADQARHIATLARRVHAHFATGAQVLRGFKPPSPQVRGPECLTAAAPGLSVSNGSANRPVVGGRYGPPPCEVTSGSRTGAGASPSRPARTRSRASAGG